MYVVGSGGCPAYRGEAVTRGTGRAHGARRSVGQDPLGNGEGRVGRWDAAVDRGLQQHLDDLLLREAVAQGRLQVELQLVEVPSRDQSGERDDGAAAAVEARPGPDAAPCVRRDEVLEVLRHVCRTGNDPVDVLVAEYLATNGHAGSMVGWGQGHECLSRCSRTAASNSTGLAMLAMCATPSRTTRSASGMPATSSSATDGGVTGSSEPAMTRVGAVMSPSRSVTSYSASASQQAAYPPGSVWRSIPSTGSTRSGWAATNSGVNQRALVGSARKPMPSARTCAARSFQPCGSPNFGPVQASTRETTRSGCAMASVCPMAPPSDSPTNVNRSRPSRSATPTTSSASSTVEYGPSGTGDPPCPRVSKRTTR